MGSKHIKTLSLLLLVMGLAALFVGASWASYTKAEKAVERISPEDARQLAASEKALLVCSYGDDSCQSKLLQGALLKSELEARLASLSMDQQIIFYCG
jgi:hypothetical protein